MAELAAAHTFEREPIYGFIDADPEIAALREEVRDEAYLTIERRRMQQEQGNELEYVPVDALSTAHAVLMNGIVHGPESFEYADSLKGLQLDCRRLIAEWFRKNKPEYFPALRHTYDDLTESFYSHGLSVRQMTENALVPIVGDTEEEVRRVNERVEDETVRIVRSLGGLALGQKIRTVSECTDKALHDYQEDMKHGRPEGSYGGYVPQIMKNMFRDVYLDPDTGDRFEVQVSTPGIYHSHEIIQMTLARYGAQGVMDMDKTSLHGSQLVAEDDLIEFVQKLDEVAGEQWCTNVFMGEEVPEDFVKDYQGFIKEAQERQDRLDEQASALTNFVLDLARDNYDRRKAPAVVEEFVKQMLLDIAKKDSSVAEQMFNRETARGLEEVMYLEAMGLLDEAAQKMAEVQKLAPGGGACGMGCGIESINQLTPEGQKLAKELGLEAGEVLVKDKERACKNPKCRKVGTVVYAYSDTKVKKQCTSCKHSTTEISLASVKKSKAQYARAA